VCNATGNCPQSVIEFRMAWERNEYVLCL
jgi:hypothetical protein